MRGVVEETDHGAGDRPERPAALHRPPGQHRQPVLAARVGDLVEQARLPDPGLARDEERTTPAGGDRVDQPAGGRELGGAADDRHGGCVPARPTSTGPVTDAAPAVRAGRARRSPPGPIRARRGTRVCVEVRELVDRVLVYVRGRTWRSSSLPVPAIGRGIGHPWFMSSRRPDPAPAAAGPSLGEILGGRGGALDASAAPVAFVAGFGIADAAGSPSALLWGGGAALGVGLVVGVVRLARGRRPAAVLAGLLGVAVAVLVALYTGRAVDFFLLQIASNAASALAWAVSIAVRWPLLGPGRRDGAGPADALAARPGPAARLPAGELGVGRAVPAAARGLHAAVPRRGRLRARDRPGGADVAAGGGVHRAVVAGAAARPAGRSPGPAPPPGAETRTGGRRTVDLVTKRDHLDRSLTRGRSTTGERRPYPGTCKEPCPSSRRRRDPTRTSPPGTVRSPLADA